MYFCAISFGSSTKMPNFMWPVRKLTITSLRKTVSIRRSITLHVSTAEGAVAIAQEMMATQEVVDLGMVVVVDLETVATRGLAAVAAKEGLTPARI